MSPKPAARLTPTAPSDPDFFDRQRTPTAQLPPPAVFTRNVARGAFEVLAGVRRAEQLTRWMSEDVLDRLCTIKNLSARARSARRVLSLYDVYEVQRVRLSSPGDGIIEATVTASARARTRALAMRIEGLDGRWRVTSLGMM
ncbi:Rv3235 family protein [Microbacterium sp. P26]|uniref:Rv3235 family protein n=1 Tax=Microbacterium TaxID=33882 RepID=UPI00203BC4B5|nr:Rv3235 family protein [Microbacterium sp. P26]MCM3500694.1 Rv3235 family protein [Microbacterium sp. P26]